MGICDSVRKSSSLQFQAAQSRQFHIEDQASRALRACSRQKFSGRAVGLHPKALRPQQTFDGLSDGCIVIHYANRSIDFVHGMFWGDVNAVIVRPLSLKGPD